MAEFILATLGFALAGPGTAIAFAKCGQHLENLANSFVNAPEAIKDLRIFGKDLHTGLLESNVRLTEWVMSVEDPSYTAVKDSLKDHLNKLRSLLAESSTTLAQCFDSKGKFRRTYFTLLGQRKAERAVRELKTWQTDFAGIIDLIDKRRRLLPEDLLLSGRELKVLHKANGHDLEPIDPELQLFLADADYMRGAATEIKILIEKQPPQSYANYEELKEVASYLSARLNLRNTDRGVLKCLGYRVDRQFELIFEVPKPLSKPQTLRMEIMATSDVLNGGYPLEARFLLCRRICEAALSVHSSGLVHKNIRPGTIVLFQDSSPNQSQVAGSNRKLGLPFLTEWRMLRKVSMLSSRKGTGDWKQDLYRHPQRQGLQPEQRYNIGHDIYSVGVTLLEISLWQPFVDPSETLGISSNYQSMALRLGFVQPEDRASVHKWTHPLEVQKVMVALAREEVPTRMGTVFTDFVIACLTCLEGGMGEVACFKDDPMAAAVRFHDFITAAFSQGVV